MKKTILVVAIAHLISGSLAGMVLSKQKKSIKNHISFASTLGIVFSFIQTAFILNEAKKGANQ
jgi:hypothetical protein